MGLLDSILGKGQPSRPAVKEKPPTLEDIEAIEKQAKEAKTHGDLYQRQAKAIEALAEAAEEEQAGKEALAQAQARLKQAKGGR
jgi:ABC-type glycerol-3-phosphate transport system substrate-binding protein